MLIPLPTFELVAVSEWWIAYFIVSLATFVGQVYAYKTYDVKHNRVAEYIFVLLMSFVWIISIPMMIMYLRDKLNNHKRWGKQAEKEHDKETNKLEMDKIVLGQEIIKLKKELRKRNKEKK